jgi:NAD(P)H-dependent FMN reductase
VEPAPPAVADLRARLGTAEAVLIASPEYAHEMPGVLKNALDWLVSSGELYGKRVAVLCASPSPERGTYLRQALERTLAAQGATVVVSSTVAVAPAQRSDEPTPDVVRAVQSALVALLA